MGETLRGDRTGQWVALRGQSVALVEHTYTQRHKTQIHTYTYRDRNHAFSGGARKCGSGKNPGETIAGPGGLHNSRGYVNHPGKNPRERSGGGRETTSKAAVCFGLGSRKNEPSGS